MPYLSFVHGPNSGSTIPLDGQTFSIGREKINEICIPHDTISRFHAKLEKLAEGWTLIDLRSSNGTRVNGRKIDRQTLTHLDEVQLGEVTLIFNEEHPLIWDDDDSTPEVTQVLDSTALDMLKAKRGELQEPLVRLFHLSTDASSCKSIPDLMAKLIDAAGEAICADRVVPITIEPGRGLKPWRPRSGEELVGLPVSTSIVNYVRKHRVAVLSDVQSDKRFSASSSLVQGQTGSVICVPLLSAGRELGVIYAARVAPAASFTRSELELLAAMAMPVVVALENLQAAERLVSERDRLISQLKIEHNIIGKHESIVRVLEMVERVAPADSSVLITGESGTGKELVARAIHLNSARSARAFEAVSCAALAPTLLESELFGHVKGAFTGAIEAKPGRFELADKGTLFLDEIGELPLDSQAKLLRVIEQGELRRVGGIKDRTVNVRIIAATNKDLDTLSTGDKFRKDLFYRLNIVRIDLPPLRARGEDIELLLGHFAQAYCQKCGRQIFTFSARSRELLRKYDWPGNVRELKNLVERLAVMCRAQEVTPEDLPAEIHTGRVPAEGDPISLADVERLHIFKILERTGGNKKEAASLLGIDRSTLYAKLKQYGIE